MIGNAEEVAFYGGAEMERGFLEKGFRDLKTLMEGVYSVWDPIISFTNACLHDIMIQMKIRYNMLEDFVLKYGWCRFLYIE